MAPTTNKQFHNRILDLRAFDHIDGNTSLFSSMASPKFPDLVTLADGSKIASRVIGQINFPLSLNQNFVIRILRYIKHPFGEGLFYGGQGKPLGT